MFKKMIFAVFAAVAVIGCNEKDVEMQDMQSGEKIQLTVNLPQAATKVTGTPADDKVNDVQIFVFDKNGLYETSSRATASTLSLTCTTGEKKIVALVNAPIESSITNIAELRARTSDLSDCSAGHIVMSGELTEVLTSSTTVTMQVERLAARVAVSQITTDFELEAHQNLSFEIKSIYLINVAGERAYLSDNTPATWYNKGQYVAATSLEFLHDVVGAGRISNGESYDTEHYFYCYPNATATKTRLVVEAEVGGYTYYYPITLNAVEDNTAYTYNLTITKLGSNSPDVPVADGTVNFTVTVKDWTVQNVPETI
jgi:hypothetical protein